ncbi:rab-GTPase-TBC domain-containing protein [Gongronella butleri]|nr:rab-GTPase-TBC domain-containing protein [Gongronella butleri]
MSDDDPSHVSSDKRDSAQSFTSIRLELQVSDQIVLRQLEHRKRLKVTHGDDDQPPSLPMDHDHQHDDQHTIFWQQLSQDYDLMVQQYPQALLALLAHHGGVPEYAREPIWQAMVHCPHSALIQTYDDLQKSLPSPAASLIQQDTMDLYAGSLPDTQMHALSDVLQAYLLYDTASHYHPNLIHLLMPLVRFLPPKEAFCVLVRLMDHFDLKMLFNCRNDDTAVQLFDMILAEHYPQVKHHLEQHHVCASLFVPTWFGALFNSVLPERALFRLYDMILALGTLNMAICTGLALVQRASNALLSITESDALLSTLGTTKLFDLAYADNDVDALVADTLLWTNVVPPSKLAHLQTLIAAARKPSAASSMAGNGGTKSSSSGRKSKRESWFWSSLYPSQQQQAPSQQAIADTAAPCSPVSGRPSDGPSASILHQQIEDLVRALSQLQRDHRDQSEELMSIKQRDVETQADRLKLQKRNAAMEKKLKKYKAKITQQQQTIQEQSVLGQQDDHMRSFIDSLKLTGSFGSLVASGLAANDPVSATNTQKTTSRRQSQQHAPVVAPKEADDSNTSSSSTNDDDDASQTRRPSVATTATIEDDAIVAEEDADATISQQQQQQQQQQQAEIAAAQAAAKAASAIQQLTSELTAVKLANYEMGQKYEQLCHKFSDAELQYQRANQKIASQAEHITQLERALEEHDQLKDSFLHEWSQEQESLLMENEDWMDKALAARKMASELHMEKLALAKQVERAEQRIHQLEEEKREYLMPRDSFSEDVFATHALFFTSPKEASATTASQTHTDDAEFRLKYVEADLRCRELEKLLAEAKVKVAEYETASMGRHSTSSFTSCSTTPSSSVCCSPRESFQRRSSSMQAKRNSTLSLLSQHRSSIMANSLAGAAAIANGNGNVNGPHHGPNGTASLVATTTNGYVPPTSPTNTNTTNTSSNYQTRLSDDSCASSATSVSSSVGSKRSSMYYRISSAFSSANATKPALCEEPESLLAAQQPCP